ncbi:DUF2306 domain-containing protein [Xanthomonas sp. AmX2]|nr:DUF2306 domain-containing protein [Xanthomonas sp.]
MPLLAPPRRYAFDHDGSRTALAWLSTALVGLRAIRRGRVPSHWRWMIRSYLVTLALITFRLMMRIPGVMELASPTEVIAILLWLRWTLPLLVCEMGYRIAAGLRRSRTGSRYRPCGSAGPADAVAGTSTSPLSLPSRVSVSDPAPPSSGGMMDGNARSPAR